MPRVIAIVGASSGIGHALATLLLDEGEEVLAISRHPENAPSGCEPIIWDATGDGLLDLPDQLDGLAYCAGSINLRPFSQIRPAQFEEDFRLNLLGAVRALQAAEKPLRAGGGSVVLFSTIAVAQGMNFHTSVASAKGAVEGLTRALAAEWAPRVRVNAIAPTLTDTPLAARLLADEDKRRHAEERHPLKRINDPAEVASLAAVLLGPRSANLTGQILRPDGGLSSVRPL